MTSRLVKCLIRHRLSSISPGIRPLAYRGIRGYSCTTLRPGTTLSTATRRISWTEPIMRRDVTTIYTDIRRKTDKGAVSGRSVLHQCVGFPGGACRSFMYRCVNKNTMRKGTFFSWAVRSAVRYENAIFVGKGYVLFTSLLKRCPVVTELRKKLQYCSYVYCVSAI